MARTKSADPAQTKERIFEAVRMIAVRDGVRGITVDAVASAAGVSKGTVGLIRIDGLLRSVIDHPFVCFLAEFAQDDTLALGSLPTPTERIERLFDAEPDVARIAVQACCLGAIAQADIDAGGSAGLAGHFSLRRQQTETMLKEFAVRDRATAPGNVPPNVSALITQFFQLALSRVTTRSKQSNERSAARRPSTIMSVRRDTGCGE